MKPARRDVLTNCTFGSPVAEQESAQLGAYWVTTTQWRDVSSGSVDIVYGPKGSGKSALYSQLLNHADELKQRHIVVIGAENPRGTPAFQSLLSGADVSERQFISLWKVYFLSLVGEQIGGLYPRSPTATTVIDALQTAGLMLPKASLANRLSAAWVYVLRWLNPSSAEAEVGFDFASGLPKVRFKLSPSDKPETAIAPAEIGLDDLLAHENTALKESGSTVWLLLDRLDVAFADSPVMEANALRALFRVYLDVAANDQIRLKIFLRSDIWSAITDKGFREASHLTRSTRIQWDRVALKDLVIRRLLDNAMLRDFYEVTDIEAALNPFAKDRLLERIFPMTMEGVRAFEWMLNETADGHSVNAPRDLIELMNRAKAEQLRQYDLKAVEPEREALFSQTALRVARGEVSRIRLEQTFYAENETLKPVVQELEGTRGFMFSTGELERLWRVSTADAAKRAERLVETGLFKRVGPGQYQLPPLYRYALNLQ